VWLPKRFTHYFFGDKIMALILLWLLGLPLGLIVLLWLLGVSR